MFVCRSVCCFPDTTGYLVGSIEGRVAVNHVDEAVASQKNFTFKCHREVSRADAASTAAAAA